MQVTCSTCGQDSEIMDPPKDQLDHKIPWQCGEPVSAPTDDNPNATRLCGAQNFINPDGKEGHPGEGTLNPAATALTDEQLAEAAVRRGLVKQEHVIAASAPEGQTETQTIASGDVATVSSVLGEGEKK